MRVPIRRSTEREFFLFSEYYIEVRTAFVPLPLLIIFQFNTLTPSGIGYYLSMI